MQSLNQKLEVTKQLNYIFEVLKEKSYQPRILYPLKISFRYESRQLKAFSYKGKLREFIARKLALKEMLRKFFTE